MLDKSHLQKIISKYYLEGLIESAKWVVKDKNLSINFVSPNKNMTGNVSVTDFNFGDAELGIYDTSKLNKLLGVTHKDIFISGTKSNKIYTKLVISDDQFTVNYSLCALHMIQKTPQIEEPEYDIEVILGLDDIAAMVKAKNAISDSDTVIIKPHSTIDEKNKLELIFGNDDEYSNKVCYYLSNITKNTNQNDYKLSYNSELIKLILNANKEISRGKMYLSLNGLMKLEFENDKIKSHYFIIQNEDEV